MKQHIKTVLSFFSLFIFEADSATMIFEPIYTLYSITDEPQQITTFEFRFELTAIGGDVEFFYRPNIDVISTSNYSSRGSSIYLQGGISNPWGWIIEENKTAIVTFNFALGLFTIST